MQLSPNFHLSEFVRPNVDPPKHVLENLKALALRLEEARTLLGNRPMIITSGYRDPEHNRRVGGVKNSYHVKGMAADFVVRGLSNRQVQVLLKEWKGGMGKASNFTHLDIRPYKARWTY